MRSDEPAEKISKLQALKATLAARGLSPRKRFGQNFMADGNFAAAIARDAASDAQTLLIEVGPGTGCLTQALLDAPQARVLAVEIDRGLAELLRETFAAPLKEKRFTLLEGDCLAGKHEINPELIAAALELSRTENRPRRVLCANLPYNAATPLLVNAAADAQNLGLAAAVVTIQLELAQRLIAHPGDSNYGAISAFMALRATGSILRKVGGEIFWPRPDVESAVLGLRFRPWADCALGKAEAVPFQEFLQSAFAQRRKMIRAICKPNPFPENLGLSGDERAEDLAPEQLLALFRELQKREAHP